MVSLPRATVRRYERFSLYNSPYPAHDRGRAIDLYPGAGSGTRATAASPVAGDVLETRTVRCPPKPYAVDHDHLIVIDAGEHLARILHVEPTVAAGDSVAVGDPLGELVRSGFFGRWVDDHLHLGFRDSDADPYRATGSLPVEPAVEVTPLAWDGTGTVVETGPEHALLDAPRRPGGRADAGGFVALASDGGVPLDGGLVHYAGGGVLADGAGDLSLLGQPIGRADGRDVTWDPVDVLVDRAGEGGGAGDRTRATGLSLFASRVPFGAKLVFHEGHDLAVGDRVTVTLRPSDDPIRLG
ncbi:MAG: hypothetical protein ABEI11_00175 [Haloarculaceae archaeon]